MTFTYCPCCATELEPAQHAPEDPPRPTCPKCGWVHYENPTPTVQAWIDRDGSFLALERNQEPEKGKWNMPGGFVEPGESGPEAVAREALEETGLVIEVIELIGIYSSTYGDAEDGKPILDIAYLVRDDGREMTISDESGEARWFPLAEFPSPAFLGERKAFAELKRRRGLN